jgi:hypothetical protein
VENAIGNYAGYFNGGRAVTLLVNVPPTICATSLGDNSWIVCVILCVIISLLFDAG